MTDLISATHILVIIENVVTELDILFLSNSSCTCSSVLALFTNGHVELTTQPALSLQHTEVELYSGRRRRLWLFDIERLRSKLFIDLQTSHMNVQLT